MHAQEQPLRAPRFATDATVSVGEGESEIRGRCKNLSSGGLCSELQGSLAVGEVQPLRLSLVFDENVESEPLLMQARPVWCTQIGDLWQVGFQFLPLDKEQTAFLKMFLRYLSGSSSR